MTEFKPIPLLDAGGIQIQPGDRVCVTRWGFGARLADCGTTSAVHRFTPTRVEITDSEGQRRTVGASCVMVLRRDGSNGYEANNR